MKTINKFFFALTVLSIIALPACEDDDDSTPTPTTPNEEELITSVDVIFTNTATSQVDTVSFKDPDGEGGNAPTTFESISIDTSATYNVALKFLDESDPNDVEDITAEIMTEDDEHLVCFTITGANGLTITRTDSDGTYEVGLSSTWTTTSAITTAADAATVRITLRHQPGVKDGTCTPGDTDIELDFPIVID